MPTPLNPTNASNPAIKSLIDEFRSKLSAKLPDKSLYHILETSQNYIEKHGTISNNKILLTADIFPEYMHTTNNILFNEAMPLNLEPPMPRDLNILQKPSVSVTEIMYQIESMHKHFKIPPIVYDELIRVMKVYVVPNFDFSAQYIRMGDVKPSPEKTNPSAPSAAKLLADLSSLTNYANTRSW
jgi:hypothetical protein